ncbi:MAG TPA: hypothetical protein VM307_05920 [Egibacteraceae bacterium]|nr:hypothetical protein [Egibacteraceae bacterium]
MSVYRDRDLFPLHGDTDPCDCGVSCDRCCCEFWHCVQAITGNVPVNAGGPPELDGDA